MRKFAIYAVTGVLLAASVGQLHLLQANSKPATHVRRAEATMLVLKNAGIKVDMEAKTYGDYPDVLDGQWFVPYVVMGIDMGLLEIEKKTGLVYPHRPVTRGEFVQMISKGFGVTTNISHQFTDVDKEASYASYAGIAWKYKILVSPENPNLFKAEEKLTHNEAIQAIYKLLAAEPSLQHIPNMVPVRQEVPEEKKQSFFKKIIDSLRPEPKPQPQPEPTPEPEPEPTAKPEPVDIDIPKTPPTRPAFSTPAAVKQVILGLIRARGDPAEKTRIDLVHAVNYERARYNLAPLKQNPFLEKSAQLHARDMHERGYFSHFTPEGRSYVDRIKGGGYLNVSPNVCNCAPQYDSFGNAKARGPDFVVDLSQCSCEPSFSMGENLAKGQLSVEQVMEDWLNSPNHRKNILRPQFEEIGIGLFGDLWVQNFGRLKVE